MKFYIIYCILQFMGRVQIGFGVGNPEEIISCGFDNKTLVGRTAQWVAGQLSGWQDSLVGGRTAQWVAGQLSGWQDSSEVEGLHAITTASCCGHELFTYSQLLPLTRTILMQTTFQVHQSNWINCQLPANYLSVTCQLLVSHLPITCQSPVNYLSVTCQLPVSHLSIICQSPANYLLVTCQLPVSHLPITCQSPVNYLPITCQSPANYVSVTCQLPANYLSVTCQYYTFRLDSESIMRIVSCQSAPVLYYSFLEHSLLIWILTPDKGLARLAVT